MAAQHQVTSPDHPFLLYLAQTQHSTLETMIYFSRRPFFGFAEEKFSLLSFINQSASFEHSFPRSLELVLIQTAALSSTF
jgi:hypothetical protein